MSAIATSTPVARRRSALPSITLLTREPLMLLLVAAYVLVVVMTPIAIAEDSWVTFVSGREIAQHGLPSVDHLTVMAQGHHWVDQQWLAQLVYYALMSAGGIVLASLVNAVVNVGAFVAALVFARGSGASQRSVFIIGLLFGASAPFGAQLRAQSLAYPLFIAVLWLLVSDSRRSSNRVLWVLPLLVVWANTHGSVVLGVALVAARGVLLVVDAVRARRAMRPGVTAACLGSPLLLSATPYGVGMAGYYHLMLVDPPFAGHIAEWAPTTLSANPLFVLLALGTIATVANPGGRLGAYERVALVLIVVLGFEAERNAIWLAFAGAMLLPSQMDRLFRPRHDIAADLGMRLLGGVAAAAIVGILVVGLSESDARVSARWSPAAAKAIAGVTADSHTHVFVSDPESDWIMWAVPPLQGRVAFDMRVELLTRAQVTRIAEFHGHRATWRRAMRGYSVFVLDRGEDGKLIPEVERMPGARVVYADSRMVVIGFDHPR